MKLVWLGEDFISSGIEKGDLEALNTNTEKFTHA